jgi:hypothetical protein
MAVAQQADRARATTRQPSLAAGGQRRRIERRLHEVGIWCHPEVSMQYQTLAERAVLRGVESGGATKEIGRYVTFCNENGGQLCWLQPIASMASNGRHAVVIAASLVSVEVFRVRTTYEVLIARHFLVEESGSERAHVETQVLFRGHEGHLPLDLTGSDKALAGRILPEFFDKAGERIEIPGDFASALKAAVRGAVCVGCTHQHYLTSPSEARVCEGRMA